MKKRLKTGISRKYIITLCASLLVFNAVLGVVLTIRSAKTTREIIYDNMLDISNLSASMLDGDVLRELREEDDKTQIINTLNGIYDYVDVLYIYVVRPEGEDRFVYIVDPDPVNPADFGEEIVYTEALAKAGKGTAAIDDVAPQDEWGSFYSAFSPVYDSDKKIAGVVGVDFDSTIIDKQVTTNVIYIVLISLLSLVISGGAVIIIALRTRRRVSVIYAELASLSDDVEDLSNEVMTSPGYADMDNHPDDIESPSGDAIETLSNRIRSVHLDLKDYISYVHDMAYYDKMTGVGNKTAYLEFIKALNQKIEQGDACFSVAVFDVNGLKDINDNQGHENGDIFITDVASIISAVFGADRVYRIGGDEFIAVLENTTLEEVDEMFDRMDENLILFNKKEHKYKKDLSFSKGASTFIKGKDRRFKEVFKRADEEMYKDKALYYSRSGGRQTIN